VEGFEEWLNTLPEIIPLVIGSFGEWSAAVDQVIPTFTMMGRHAGWRGGAPSLRASERTRLGICGLRRNARLP